MGPNMGHTAASAWSMLTFVTELYPPRNCNRGGCTKKNLKRREKARMTNTQWNTWPTLNNFDQTWGIQEVQVGQRWYFRRDSACQQIVAEIPVEKKLERLRKRHTWPTLNNVYDQHSTNVPFWGIQCRQVRQCWYLWWNCACQGVQWEPPVRKKSWKTEREARNTNTQ